jgi:hypothetical protein
MTVAAALALFRIKVTVRRAICCSALLGLAF